MESVSTRLDNEMYRITSETADERDVSKAEVLRELVEKVWSTMRSNARTIDYAPRNGR